MPERAEAAAGDLETEPATLGSYRLLRRLAQGGMGTVYEAEQSSARRGEGDRPRDGDARSPASLPARRRGPRPHVASGHREGPRDGRRLAGLAAFIAHPTTDLEASCRFFREALGLEETARFEDHWVEFRTPGGGTIALDTFSPKNVPDQGPYLALETDDIAAETARLKESGATVLMEPWDNTDQDGQPVCKMAMLRGPDGHYFMLHEIAPERA